MMQGPGGNDMPQIHFTNSVVQKLQDETGKGTWYSEPGGKGLRLYVGTSGKKTWYVNYRKPSNTKMAQHKIGDADLYSVSQAQEEALKFLAAVVRGEAPYAKPETPPDKLTLEAFINEHYGPWVLEYRRSGAETVAMIKSAFAALLQKPIEEISVEDVERWQEKKRREDNSKAATLNRLVTALKAALNWGVKRGIIETNNMARVEHLREEDSNTKVRYLSEDERGRLFAALDAREERIKTGRESHNEWLDDRDREQMPDMKDLAFADYLKPMVIVSLNTGIRRGSLFKLRWNDIDFKEEILTVRADSAKSGKQVQITMSTKLIGVLAAWKAQTCYNEKALVFPSPKGGGVMDNCRKAWANLLKEANIKDFRWHDMRHDFASQLVMKGVDLNTVRELMGHADMKMTLRYAHLAPKVKKAAVELLG
jgi:integrase